ncbi:MAG: ATPase, T2SS/T4P/T4SS family, partial [Pseudomonadota bacterium]
RDLNQALALQKEAGGLLGHALLRLGAVTEEDLLTAVADQLDLSIADDSVLPDEPEAFTKAAEKLSLPARWFTNRRCVAWLNGHTASLDGDGEHAALEDSNADASPSTLHIVAADPLDLELRETLEAAAAKRLNSEDSDADTPSEVVYHLGSGPTLDYCLGLLEKKVSVLDDDALADTARLREMAEEAPVIDFVNAVLAGALKENASDIHVEAFEHSFVVRYRIDGVLHTRRNEGRTRFDAIASRIKLIAGMDIAERRLPQDGRHTIRFAGNDIDLRVSSVPSTWGESLVVRLLRKQSELPDLEGLGLTGRAGEALSQLLECPNGIVLVTGPTGSGKSTTLYRGLERINDGYRKIITIEDPVEYDIGGVTQIQVKADIGYTFASGLRAVLRQDPDVIMVGEIRDGETATIAAQAALTGHLVLSTLHTNSSLAAVTRLEDIGLERFLISASVRGLIAQRLVRRLCPSCQRDADPKEGDSAWAAAMSNGADFGQAANEPAKWREAVGCSECDNTGYKGRLAVFEIVKLDEDLKQGVMNGASLQELFLEARKQGFLTLFEDGLMKARAGLTTLSEVQRVCGSDMS